MPMTDFVVREAILPALASTTKDAVIREIDGGAELVFAMARLGNTILVWTTAINTELVNFLLLFPGTVGGNNGESKPIAAGAGEQFL